MIDIGCCLADGDVDAAALWLHGVTILGDDTVAEVFADKT